MTRPIQLIKKSNKPKYKIVFLPEPAIRFPYTVYKKRLFGWKKLMDFTYLETAEEYIQNLLKPSQYFNELGEPIDDKTSSN